MKPLSPKRIALIIALFATIFFAFAKIITFKLSGNVLIMFALGVMIVLFVLVYIISLYFINNFIFDKIKPIYRTIHNSWLSTKELRKAFGGQDVITEVKNDVGNWNSSKSEEIDQLRQLEKIP